ncbi:MAG: hypothetical protein V4492_01685 [Chlamydiota bacterium]
MSDYNKFVGGSDPAPYQKIIVNPLEQDKKNKDQSFNEQKNAPSPQIIALLFTYVKKMLNAFSSREKDLGELGPMVGNIAAFRRMLFTLAQQDLSHNPEFAQHLSELWHEIQDASATIAFSKPSASSALLPHIAFFLSQVKNYPIGAEYTLSYYFNEYAGKEWIPFPFMELLQNLHRNYQDSPETSTLYHWISLLDEILADL